jgi:hypothetical protein
LQNDLLTGLLLLMLAIVPNEASLPPQAWREFYAEKRSEREPAPHSTAAEEVETAVR